MNIRESAKTETRTLGKYIKAKLCIRLSEFARLEETSVSTLNDRWKSPNGKIRIMQAVVCVGIERMEGL
jgi:hypothetical protein